MNLFSDHVRTFNFSAFLIEKNSGISNERSSARLMMQKEKRIKRTGRSGERCST
jgi:hypothetical protein